MLGTYKVQVGETLFFDTVNSENAKNAILCCLIRAIPNIAPAEIEIKEARGSSFNTTVMNQQTFQIKNFNVVIKPRPIQHI